MTITHQEIGSVGGRSGFGASKRRSREHYSRISLIAWAKKRKSIAERFWEKVDKKSENECWNWMGCVDPGFGHGRFSVNNKSMVSSRVAWEISIGHPGSLYVCHKCDNPKCCNPSHLFLGTAKDNTADMIKKGRKIIARGVDSGKAKFTEAQILEIRKEYSEKRTPHSILAKRYGCAKSTIHVIVNRKVWNHI